MPYLPQEKAKAIRTALKKALPEYKLSVTVHHHSSLNVTLMEGPIHFDDPRDQVNHFHYQTMPKERGNYGGELYYTAEQIALFDKILAVIAEVHPVEVISEDGDYGSIPNYYMNLNVGKWDKHYTQKAA